MLRRHVIDQDLRYSHQTTPRKQRTYAHAGAYAPSVFYKSRRGLYVPASSWEKSPASVWVGKIFIPMTASPDEIQTTLAYAAHSRHLPTS